MPQQVTRLLIVFLVALGCFVAVRSQLVPETFGELGHYRAAAIDANLAREKKYAGHEQCALCHSSISEARLESNHRGVRCEVCHGPAAAHVAAPMDAKPEIVRERDACTLCHEYNPTRPSGFPQIDPATHNPVVQCIACHSPHMPEPVGTPEECSACHGQIARQKAVSHHASLSCATCHDAPDQHKNEPQSVRPTKPAERTFCGMCHSSGIAGVPQVDMRSHNPTYLCWQCHYPHFPETE